MTIFVSAFVDDSAALYCPFTSVFPLALVPLLCPTVNVFPLPLALNVTAWLCTGAPLESVTVAVIVAVLVPSAVTLLALVAIATVSAPVVALLNVTDELSSAVCAPPTVAVTVSVCAALDVRAASISPLESVFAVTVLPLVAPLALNVFPLPLAPSVTAWFVTGLPFASTSSSKICVLPPTVSDAGLTSRLEPLATAAPASNVTATALLAPVTLAVTVFASAFVDDSVALNVPSAPLVPLALASNVFALPLAASVTLCPLTAAPFESVTVAVIVALLVPSAVTLAALVVTDTNSAPVLVFVKLIGAVRNPLVDPAFSDTVSFCTSVDDNDATKSPLPFVVPLSVAPLVSPLAENVLFVPPALSFTLWPATALPFASLSCTTTLAAPPAATLAGLTSSDDTLALAAPATYVTATEFVVAPAAAVTSFSSAFVDVSVALNTPLPFVVPLAVDPVVSPAVNSFPLPLELSVTLCPLSAFPLPSVTVAVIVAALVPSAVTLLALVVTTTTGCDAVGTNDTVAVSAIALWPVPSVAVTVFVSARLDDSVAVKSPAPFVVPLVALSVFPLPLADSATPSPLMVLPFTSLA